MRIAQTKIREMVKYWLADSSHSDRNCFLVDQTLVCYLEITQKHSLEVPYFCYVQKELRPLSLLMKRLTKKVFVNEKFLTLV